MTSTGRLGLEPGERSTGSLDGLGGTRDCLSGRTIALFYSTTGGVESPMVIMRAVQLYGIRITMHRVCGMTFPVMPR